MNGKERRDQAERAERDRRSMDAARELRARREAARGRAVIDGELHRSLPLTRAFVPLFGLTVVAFLAARFFEGQGNDRAAQICGIALGVLFLTSFVVWFVSRHQAKKLTAERYGDDGLAG